MQKLDDLLLNLVVVFEACRIKGVTPLQASEAAKQLFFFKRVEIYEAKENMRQK